RRRSSSLHAADDAGDVGRRNRHRSPISRKPRVGERPLAPEERRSEALSSYLIAVYCGNSLPVIGAGVLSTLMGGAATHIVFGVVISLLALFAYLESQGARPDKGEAEGSGM